MISGKTILAVSVCLAAYLCVRWKSGGPQKYLQPKERIISAWQTQIEPPVDGFRRVSLGINACVDLIVNGTQLLQALDVKPSVQADHMTLKSLNDLQEAFHHYFARGAGGERCFENKKVYQDVIATASKLSEGQWNIGGNAALMAENIAASFPDVQVQLVAPIGPKLHELLNQDISLPKNSFIPSDEVHLIMEYLVGEKWGRSVATVATRFITSADESNSELRPLNAMFDNLEQFQPDLVVFSGLHMLDGQKARFRFEKLNALSGKLSVLPHSLPTHLELASMADTDLVTSIMDKIVDKVSSLGLNEQELVLISHLMGGPHKEIYNMEGRPIIHKVTDTLTWLLEKFGFSAKRPGSRLTRVHFHTLTYHLIGSVPGVWGNSDGAVAAGTQRAGRQACDTPTIDPEKADLKIPAKFQLHSGDKERIFSHSKPVTSFTHKSFMFSFSPVLVCKKPLKTVGLGDAISATGLLYSTYNSDHLWKNM